MRDRDTLRDLIKVKQPEENKIDQNCSATKNPP